ncbi:MAG: zinc dependent phospholipase C family protein [Promethearchaeota archaeon]
MATWGSHFRIAENILKKYPNLNRKLFTIGNIAPDCGLPNKDWSDFTPSKEISHFTTSEGSDFLKIKTEKFILNDIEFYSKYLLDFDLNAPRRDRSFHLGYFIHLVTDNLWNYFIMKPLKDEYLEEFQKNPEFIWEVKRDWYDLDKIYITKNKDSLFWTDFLEAEYNENIFDYLPIEGVQRQLKFIKKFYQISQEEYLKISKKEFIYLEKKEMDNFIHESTEIILKILRLIQEKDFDIKDKTSALNGIVIWD